MKDSRKPLQDQVDIRVDAGKQPDQSSERNKTSAPAPETVAMPRRALFGTGLISAFGLLAQACSSEFGGFADSTSNRKKSDKPAGDGGDSVGDIPAACRDLAGTERQACIEQDAGGDDLPPGADDAATPPADSAADDACIANNTTKIDLSNIPLATGDLQPRVVMYGKDGSTMLVMKWTTSKALGTLIVASPSGKLYALHGITGADKNDSGYRPIVIDNLNLSEGGKFLTEIRVVVQMAEGSVQCKVAVAFNRTYKGDPVVDLANGGAVTANFNKWSVTRFTENGGFDYDANVKYPGAATNTFRGLNTVTKDSKWNAVSGNPNGTYTGVLGDDFTDIMGDKLDTLSGATILEHQVFCTYWKETVTVGGVAKTTYYRTILHIG